jgi:hypothetical protein
LEVHYLSLSIACKYDECNVQPYSEADAARLMREVASALSFLHGIGKKMLK